jgi:Family of unknown function (DUF6444)
MYQDDLAKLSRDELIALGLAQAAQIEAQAAQITELARRVAELEAKLGQPPKTPDNSSVPPSQGRKANRTERRAAKKRKGRPGVFRALADNPDRIVESLAERCPHCAHELPRMISSDFTLTTYRVAGDSAGRHPHSPASRHLPALPSRVQCVATCRHAAGLAFRPRSDGADRAPARHPGDRLGCDCV